MQVEFVIGGAQKGGTSALDSFLRQHPEICMPTTQKELHYFDTERYFQGKPNYKLYHAHFQPKPPQRVLGDATPVYMYWNTAPYRIWSYNPGMKWILVLRDPVQRAFSQWNMLVQRQVETLSFREAVEQEAVRCREALPLQHPRFSYLDRGYYASQVRRLFNIFGRENCLVLLNEDLHDDHQNTLHSVFEFLGVDSSFIPPAARVFKHDYHEELDPQLSAELTEAFYYDIKQLERLLGRDLSAWYAK